MKVKHYLILYLAAAAYFTVIGLAQKTPGYMDASYYYVTGQQLATGRGAIEPFLWNYLNNPQQIPSTAFTYWMPLSALLAALGMWLSHSTGFLAARSIYVVLAAFIPVLTVYFAAKFTENRVNLILVAIFSLLCGSYLPYITITETFLPFFILGGAYLLIARSIFNRLDKSIDVKWSFAILGVISGLMHLTRADGILWLMGGLIIVLSLMKKNRKIVIGSGLFFIIGYSVIMFGWYIRNLVVIGTPFPSGSSLAVWFTNYNDLFMYPASRLTPSHFLESGIQKIINTRLVVGYLNLKNLFGVVANVVLLPFMIIGMWKTRKSKLTRFVLLMVVLLFSLMTFVFPYAGFRGGFFHSMSAFQIFLWAIAIPGLDATVNWSVAKLKWIESKSRILFCVAITLGIGAMSCVAYMQKIGLDDRWNAQFVEFAAVDRNLAVLANGEDFSVMINDSPSYYAATGRQAIQLSSGSAQAIQELMDKFDIQYLIVDEDCPESIQPLVKTPGDQMGFILVNQDPAGYYIYSQE